MDNEVDPVELQAPDISPYAKGNVGIDYATTFDSGRGGPHVLVSAVVHGNEICGAIALDWLFKQNFRPFQGKLTLLFCNVAAYRSFDPKTPYASRFVDEDFNRVWNETTLDGPRQSQELARAREIRPLVASADLLLDIHSMQHATPALMLCGPHQKGRRFARQVGVPAIVVGDEGHSAGKRMRDYGDFGDPASTKNALLVECGQHWESGSADMARQCLVRFLVATGAASAEWASAHLSVAAPPPQRVIEVTEAVTIKSDAFRFAAPFKGLETIARKGDPIADDGGTPVLAPYDDCVLIMPTRRLGRGQTAVRLGREIA
jgi:predicted deacylase